MPLRAVASIAFPVAAAGLQWLLSQYIDTYTCVLYFPAVIFSTQLGGSRCGLASTLLSATLAWTFFTPGGSEIDSLHFLSVGILLLTGYLMSRIQARLERAHGQLESVGRRTEESRHREERWRLMEASVKDYAIMTLDPQGLVISWNEGARRLKGYAEPEILGRSMEIFYTPEDQARGVPARLLESAAVDGRCVNEGWRVRKDGTRFIADVVISAMRDASGRLVGFAKITRDITERKTVEEALEQTRHMLIEAQKIAHLGSFEYIAATRTTVWSEEEYRIYGIDPATPSPGYEDMLARCIHPDDAARLHEVFTQAMQSRSTYELEHRIVRPNGDVRWVYDRAQPYFDDEGNLLRYVGATLDITERRQAEAALREAEQQARRTAAFNEAVLKSLGEGLFTTDDQGLVTSLNPAAEELFGWTREEVLGKPMHDMTHHHDRDGRTFPESECASAQVLVHGRALKDHEDIFIRKDGSFFDVVLTVTPLREDGGKIAGLIVVFNDVTERKRREEALRQSAVRYRSLVDNLPQLIWQKDADSHYVTCNAAYARSLGIMAEAIAGKTDHDFYPSELAEKYRAGDLRILADGIIETFDEQWLDGDRIRYVHTTKVPLRDKDGRVYGTLGIAEDITEQKTQADELDRYRHHLEDVVAERTAALTAAKIDAEQAMERFRAMFEQAPLGVTVVDSLNGHIIDANPRFAEITGRTRAQISGLDWMSITHPDDVQENLDRLARLNSGEIAGFHMNKRYLRPDGSTVWVSLTTTPLRVQAGVRLRHLAMVEDITERRLDELRLELAARVFTHAREAIAITDAEGRIIESNETYSRVTGYLREEARGQAIHLLQSDQQPAECYAALWNRTNTHGHWSGELWDRRKNGDLFAAMLTISIVRDARGNPQNYVALFTDITRLKEYQRQLEHSAHHDTLTHLPNRVLLADRLRKAMAQAQRRGNSLAVIYLDLDGFKAVNDEHGHDVGDELLVVVSQRMKAALREEDTLARIGGDEFVAVVVDLNDSTDCEPVLERLLRATAEPARVRSLALHISVSIGVTFYPQDDVDADHLLRHSDQAMYVAKQTGRNRYKFFETARGRDSRSSTPMAAPGS